MTVELKYLVLVAGFTAFGQQKKEELFEGPINVTPPHISTPKDVKYDYDIVYVRTPRKGDKASSTWTEIAHPAIMDASGDLMLLHPDGTEEVLVKGGDNGSVTDPAVSFDAQWVYFSRFYDVRVSQLNSQRGDLPYSGADIFRINLQTRAIQGRLVQIL